MARRPGRARGARGDQASGPARARRGRPRRPPAGSPAPASATTAIAAARQSWQGMPPKPACGLGRMPVGPRPPSRSAVQMIRARPSGPRPWRRPASAPAPAGRTRRRGRRSPVGRACCADAAHGGSLTPIRRFLKPAGVRHSHRQPRGESMSVQVQPGAYKDVVLFLATAGVVVPLFRRWKLSPILGFLGAGVLLGPYGLGVAGQERPVARHADHRQPRGSQPTRRIWGGVPAVHDRAGAQLAAAAHHAPLRLRPGRAAGDPQPGRHRHRRPGAGPAARGGRRHRRGPGAVLHRDRHADPRRAQAPAFAGRAGGLLGAAVPGPGGGADPGDADAAGPARRSADAVSRSAAGLRAGGAGRRRAAGLRPAAAAANAAVRRESQERGTVCRRLPPGGDRGGVGQRAHRPFDGARRLHRRTAAGRDRVPPRGRGDDRAVQGPAAGPVLPVHRHRPEHSPAAVAAVGGAGRRGGPDRRQRRGGVRAGAALPACAGGPPPRPRCCWLAPENLRS